MSSYPFPSYFYNQNFPNQFNFPNFPHFQSHHLQKVPNLPYQFPSLSSSQASFLTQENQVNFHNPALQSLNNSYFPLENIKTEHFIQPKYEDEYYHDSSFQRKQLPVKLEVKKEDDLSLSPRLLPQSKKIIKKPSSSQSSPHQPTQLSTKKSPMKKTRRTWSPEEDAQLLELVNKYGLKWSKIASFMKSRNGKQVRDHYLNALAPDINRGVWTDEEDNLILSHYNKYGAQWCRIAECLSGRTETQVKGRFYTNLKQKLVVKNVKVEIVIDDFIKEEEEI